MGGERPAHLIAKPSRASPVPSDGPGPEHAAAGSTPSATGTSRLVHAPRHQLHRINLLVARARLEYVFLVIALAWGVVQVFLVPPLQVPDEGDHWFRAWALADGQLFADRQGMVTLPASFARLSDLYTRAAGTHRMPISWVGQAGFTSYEDIFNGPGPSGTVKIVSLVPSYSPVGYLPQAVGIDLGRLMGAPPLTSFYLARLANLFAAIALLFFAIRLAPFGKQLFLFIALLPMTMYELASVACDALTISGAIFFIALVLWASRRSTLRRIDVALVLAVAALLLNLKPGYWALVLLVLLIRPAQLGGGRRYAAFVAASVLAVAGTFAGLFLLTSADARVQAAGAAGGARGQLLVILQHPLRFLADLGHNLRQDLFTWIQESIGRLGWLRIIMPPAVYATVGLTGLGFFFRMREDVGLQRWQRALLAAVAVAVFTTIAALLYAILTPVGGRGIFIQGRYLPPVWLLLLLSVYGIAFARRQLGRLFVVGALLAIIVQNLATLALSYPS
jgi:hypothetical protein